VNVNPLYTARELEHQLKDSGATAIVILENFAATLQDVIERTDVQHVVLASIGDLLGPINGRWLSFAVRHLAKMVPTFELPLSGGRTVTPFNKAIAQGRGLNLRPTAQTMDDTAFLQYTGGTTGLSKGAVLTHRNVVAAILQAEGWFSPALADIPDLRQVNNVAALPLFISAPPLDTPVPFKVRASAVPSVSPFKSSAAPLATVVPAPVVPNGVLVAPPAAPSFNMPALMVVAPV
jgi:acyl-CoA synthetase (AMP-forming)/AMP-acid ligase II